MLNLAGHAVEAYLPEDMTQPAFAVMYLHTGDEESLRDAEAFTAVFDQLKLTCLAPRGGRTWWADRRCAAFDPVMTPEQHLLANVVPWTWENWGLPMGRIGLLGVSMGGQAALRLAFKYPQTFPVVAAVAPSIDHHEVYDAWPELQEMYPSKEHVRQDTAPMHIDPHEPPLRIFFCCDPTDTRWFRGNDRLHEKLRALGVAHTADLTTRAGGHSWDYFNRLAERAIRFVHEGLLAHSRRLL